MRNILQALWGLQVATWVWLLAAAPLQGVDDSDMELLHQGGSRSRVSAVRAAVLQCRDSCPIILSELGKLFEFGMINDLIVLVWS